ncbi:MAG: TRAM domain-containing protein, partial [Actinomycetota bacterium]
IEERALPFQVGEEVLVTIEEPHMYNDDDAIARVDSYIVSVAGAAPHVGKRKLVRIESVERSAALASLIDGGGADSDGAGGGDGGAGGNGADEVKSSSSRRRRGRRGGRRRSRARSASGESKKAE